ncbi:hypothetical protein H072_7296 [Dactylellina haptotyla CBS 200.50]|uniref:Ricin B lectin domain-containing protein n=1 Tax=Dactylellina haptotyla (strain CBS 200.50) TaxID=1284197 RepID=S8BI37_DACHA|nr:hypothetical protein H072_7296 [Dactylellina haptotyla CBS 200.50]
MAHVREGQYYIRSKFDSSFPKYVGRTLAEDRSLLPKQIYQLPTGPGYPAPRYWHIQEARVDVPGFILEADGAKTSPYQDRVAAYIYEDVGQEFNPIWILEPIGGPGAELKLFRIRAQNGKYWSVDPSSGPNVIGYPILLRDPDAADPASQVFEFIRVEEDIMQQGELRYEHSYSGNRHNREGDKEYRHRGQGRFGYGKRERKFCA